LQGPGTFGIESVITSAIAKTGMLLNIVNGNSGRMISKIARIHDIPLVELIYRDNQLPDTFEIESLLNENSLITHVSMVHGEASSGIINPIIETGEIVKQNNAALIVETLSTFGAYYIDMKKLNISYLISSPDKCLGGMPGLSFVLAKSTELEKCRQQARTLSLDLYEDWKGFETNRQFRFTPPVQPVMAFHEALNELELEGGISGRACRYLENNIQLVNRMRRMGFELYLPDHIRGYLSTTFLYPWDKKFCIKKFSSSLSKCGFKVYPGEIRKTNCFRIENTGNMYSDDINYMTDAIQEVLDEMDIFPITDSNYYK
jgi:2-aminoethylphosphonate-pyruvate transaminase